MIREAMLDVLSAFMTETREGLNAIRRDFEQYKNHTTSKLTDLSSYIKEDLYEKVDDINEKVCNLSDSQMGSEQRISDRILELQLPILKDVIRNLNSITESVTAVNGSLEEYKNLTSAYHTEQLTQQDELYVKVMSVNSELEYNVVSNVTEQLEKTSDFLHASLGHTVCGGTGGWRRVVYLDMTDPNTDCPSGWQLTEHSKRTCGRGTTGSLICDSVTFPVGGGTYTSVCGTVRAYQYRHTDAFEAYNDAGPDGEANTIDSAYVSGISLTHGSPRQHIWTFAAGGSESPTNDDSCPCDATINIAIPPFVGGDYFCESGANSLSIGAFYPYDPLWDGDGCTRNRTCCSLKNPPYFIKQLPNPTTDDIEARICQLDNRDDTPIELIELYVKFEEITMTELKNTVLSNVTKELKKTSDTIQNDLHNVTEELMKGFDDDLRQVENNVLNYFTMELQNTHDYHHVCGDTGGWRRVVYLDMTDTNTNCPSGWQLTEHSKRTCGGYDIGKLFTCDSVIFPVSGAAYTSVCGRIRGYQNSRTDAFEAYHVGSVTTIDGAYVSGVSLTHGSPRQHIWTFATGASESDNNFEACPCDSTASINIPSFVGSDFFCESGVNSGSPNDFHSDDPLWDGEGCSSSSTCCSFNNPPYFTKQLPSPTTDDIEVRLCRLEAEDDSPLEFIEIYVKVDEEKGLEHNVLNNVTKEILKTLGELQEDLEQVEYNVTKELQKTYNNVISHGHVCGGTGGWRRVMYLDMTDTNTNCPSGWQLTGHSNNRTCGRVSSGELTCDSVTFPVSGGAYTSVCGTIRAYHNWDADGFEAYHDGQVTTIDGAYVSGVSLTHGNPRQHIWTFAASATEIIPCDGTNFRSFVGGDYFCESRANSGSASGFHPDDGCISANTTCNSPPYFTKQFRSSTIDDIEARLCHWDRDDTLIEFMELYVKMDEVNMKELEHNILSNVTKELKTTYSTLQENLEQAEDNVRRNVTAELQTTYNNIQKDLRVYVCGGTGGWRRVVNLDMTDSNTNCPSGWRLTGHSKRTCGRVSTGRLTCDSVIFPVSGGAYTSVCGTIRAYQYSHTDAFEAYDDGDATTIDGAYVAGVSLTHGSPRQHIWTFAAGRSEIFFSSDDACPCDATINIDIPSFVGEDYFCESGVNSGSPDGFHTYDPLWDGEGCTSSSTCCSINNPPYFTKQLLNPTTDDIEARLCQLDNGDDSPIEFIELYVKLNEVNGEYDILNNVTKELQKTYNNIQKDHLKLENNITKEIQNTRSNLQDDLEQVEHNIIYDVTRELQTTCGGTGDWTRVAYLDMTDPNTNCPSGWQLTGHSKRTCGIVTTADFSCDSVIFPVSGGAYKSVRGTIRAYQNDATDGFEAYDFGEVTTIDGAYVTGVSLTHGSPRQHIWTFAAGVSESFDSNEACPCDTTTDIAVPPFVGGDYFCESGVNLGSASGFHPYDPLWDGKNCTSSSTCCSFNNPPYFTKQLPNPTTDDIEVRLCHWDRDDTPIEFIELYVKFDEIYDIEHNALSNVTEVLQKTYDNILSNVTEELQKTYDNILRDHQELEYNVTQEIQKCYDNIQEDLEQMEHDVKSNISQELQKNYEKSVGYICGGTGGWRRVIYLDMTDTNTNCPSGWQLTGHPKRTCSIVSTDSLTCDSVIFPVSGGAYTSVCGTIRAYQYDHTDAFEAYDDGEVTTIDGAYVNGVSLTHGSPRQHIWTFAAGYSEGESTRNDACPCDATIGIAIPSFVNGDYFCESGVNSGSVGGFHPYDPLWDGEGCSSSSTCCSFNNPPYFTKQLLNPTTDDIEVRLCHLDGAISPIEFIELFVKSDEVNVKRDILNNVTNELQKTYNNIQKDHLKLENNITKEIQNTRSNLHDELEQVENNVISNVTRELQTNYDNLQKSHGHVCGGTGGWRRVVYLDMTDPNTNCPSGWRLTGHSKRTCGGVSTGDLNCDSVIFPVSGGAYTSVCGTIRAYRNGFADAFEAYDDGQVTTIDGAYVSGVSLTHGSPRQHIWTFAAGASESLRGYDYSCPCDATSHITIPPFVGDDYFCESGANSGSGTNSGSGSGFYEYDPLWDGEGCTSSSTCCSFNNPPYFTKQIFNPTTDDIEARLCWWESGDETPIEFIDLYVK